MQEVAARYRVKDGPPPQGVTAHPPCAAAPPQSRGRYGARQFPTTSKANEICTFNEAVMSEHRVSCHRDFYILLSVDRMRFDRSENENE